MAQNQSLKDRLATPFLHNYLDGKYNPQKAFVYKRKKIVRKNDPLPEVFKVESPYANQRMRPKSASFVVSRRRRHTLRNATPTDSPYSTPRAASRKVKNRPTTAPNTTGGIGKKIKSRKVKSKYIVSSKRMETKEEAITRRRKELLKQKKERVRTLRTMKRVSRVSTTLTTNDEQKYKLPVMVGNYAQPGVISYPSTKEKEEPKHFENISSVNDYGNAIEVESLSSAARPLNRVKTTFTMKELFTSIIPKRILYADLIYTVPLMELNLNYWPVDDHFLHMLASSKSPHKDIKSLHISHCFRVTDKGLSELDGCREIESFDVSGIQNITDHGISVFVKTHPRIKSFNLSHCQSITGIGVQALIMGCRRFGYHYYDKL